MDQDNVAELKIAIIGNANSVMLDAFSLILQRTPGLNVVNRSIGGTPSVILLDFLAREPDLDFDFVIVETAATDFLLSGHYPRDRAKETLELFISHLRGASRAQPILIIIPTRQALLTPGVHWQEPLYREIAARYNVPVLDGYNLLRTIIGRPKMEQVGLFVQQARKLVTAFRLPETFIWTLAWRSLRDDGVTTNALGILGFGDDEHYSFVYHKLVGAILQEYVASKRRTAETPRDAATVVIAARAIGGRTQARSDSLITRELVSLKAGETVRYCCPPGYRAFGILVNQAQTAGFLQFTSNAGSTALDVRFSLQSTDWNAVIIPITDDIGDSDIEVTLLDESNAPAQYHGVHGAGAMHGQARAEVGELILVNQDWRDLLAPEPDVKAAPRRIEDEPWVKPLIAEAASWASTILRGIEGDGKILETSTLAFVSRQLASVTTALSVADQARLLLATGQTEALHDLIERAYIKRPDDAELNAMRAGLHQAKAEKDVNRQTLLESGMALARSGDLDGAEAVLAQGMARFTGDIAFQIEYTRIPFARRDFQEAERRSLGLRDNFPDMPVGYVMGALSLRELKKIDDAVAMLRVTIEKFPENDSALIELGWTETRRHNWSAAVNAWQLARERFPNHSAGYVGGSEAHQGLGELDAADALLSDARSRFPNDIGIAFSWANLAGDRKDWLEAARRWLDIQQAFPSDVRAHIAAVRVLQEAGDHVRVDEVLTQAQTLYPAEKEIAFTWADAAGRRGDWAEAATRWDSVRDRFPGEPRAYHTAMHACLAMNDQARAEAVATLAAARFQSDADMMMMTGHIAMRGGSFDAAADRLALAYAASPDKIHIAMRYAEALLSIDRRAEATVILDQAIEKWPGNEELLRWRIENALRAHRFGDALDVWLKARKTWPEDRPFFSKLALHIVRATPDADTFQVMFDYLSSESDTGERTWLPAFTELGGLLLRPSHPLRPLILEYLSVKQLDRSCHLLWKSLVGAPITDQEIDEAFVNFLARGRIGIVATLFADFASQMEPTLRGRTSALFEQYVDSRLQDPTWINEENALELLSFLMFAAVYSSKAYQALANAALARLQFDSIPADAAPDTAATALAKLLRGLKAAALKQPAAPALLPQLSRRVKAALCVSGQLRGYERAFTTWRNLSLDDLEITTFVHTWKDRGRNWGRTWDFVKPYPALWNNLVGDNRLGFLKGRFPRLAEVAAESFATGQDTKVSDLRDFYQTEHVVVEDDKTGIFEAKPAVFKMHYKIEQCHRLAKSHMPDDALYVRIRPDQSFGPADPIDWDKVHQEATSHRRLLVDIPYVYTGKSGIFKLADAFLLGAEEPMSIFASLFSTQMALTEAHKTFFDAPPVLFPHASIGFSTFYNGVAARAFTEARPTGFVEAKILAPAQILALLRQDVGDDSKDQLEQDFIAACQSATATEPAVTA